MAVGLPRASFTRGKSPRQETCKEMAATSSSEHEELRAFRQPSFLLPASVAPQPSGT